MATLEFYHKVVALEENDKTKWLAKHPETSPYRRKKPFAPGKAEFNICMTDAGGRACKKSIYFGKFDNQKAVDAAQISLMYAMRSFLVVHDVWKDHRGPHGGRYTAGLYETAMSKLELASEVLAAAVALCEVLYAPKGV